MKTQHTPGPWELQAGRSFSTSSGDFYLTYGTDKHGNPNFRDFCELDLNARLIAAAPDLLAALEAIIKMIGPYAGQGRMDTEISAARAAIAKAKGE